MADRDEVKDKDLNGHSDSEKNQYEFGTVLEDEAVKPMAGTRYESNEKI